jgi:hypothetical protein
MVAHQHIGMDQQLVLLCGLSDLGQKLILVGSACENGFAALAPGDDMIKSIIVFDPQRT